MNNTIDIFINSALESARLSLCDIFTVNVNDLYAISDLIRKILFLALFAFLKLNHQSSYLRNFVENKGVEPLTSCVQGRRSSQLS